MMKTKRKAVLCAGILFLALMVFFLPVTAASNAFLSKEKLTLYVGRSYKLTASGFAGEVTWKSSDKKVATVTAKGKVTAKKAGTAKITATYGKVKRTCKVTVKPVKLGKTKRTITQGKSFKLTLYCGTKSGITWTTSKKSAVKIKKVDGNKVVLKAKKAGKATITATYKNKKYKCVVTVKAAEVTPTPIPIPTFTPIPAERPDSGKVDFPALVVYKRP